MMRSIFLRTLYDKRWFTLGWSIALAATAGIMVAMYPSLRTGMEDIAASMPPQLQGLIGDISAFNNLESYLASQLYDIRIPLLSMIMATILAVSVSVSTEEKGQLRTVLAGKTSRAGWFIQTWYSALVITTVMLLVTSLATVLTAWGIGDSVSLWTLTQLGVLTLAFTMMMFTIVFGLGAATGSRGLSLGIGMGLIVVSFILEAGRAVDWLDPVQFISLLYYYDASKITNDGVEPFHQLVILGVLSVSFLIGLLRIRRRDIG